MNVNRFPSGSNSFRHLEFTVIASLIIVKNYHVIAITLLRSDTVENFNCSVKNQNVSIQIIFISLIKYWNCNSLFIQPHRVRKHRLVQRSRFKTRFNAVEFYFYHVTQSNDKKCLFAEKTKSISKKLINSQSS